MKCVLCGGKTKKQIVQEEITFQSKGRIHHILVSVEAEVCQNCGEKYFKSGTIDYLNKIKEKFKKNTAQFEPVGKVYKSS